MALAFLFSACNKDAAPAEAIGGDDVAVGVKAYGEVKAPYYMYGWISAQTFAKFDNPFNNGEKYLLKDGDSYILLVREKAGNGPVTIKFENAWALFEDYVDDSKELNIAVRYEGTNNVGFTFVLPACDNKTFILGGYEKDPGNGLLFNSDLRPSATGEAVLNGNKTKEQLMGDVTQVRINASDFKIPSCEDYPWAGDPEYEALLVIYNAGNVPQLYTTESWAEFAAAMKALIAQVAKFNSCDNGAELDLPFDVLVACETLELPVEAGALIDKFYQVDKPKQFAIEGKPYWTAESWTAYELAVAALEAYADGYSSCANIDWNALLKAAEDGRDGLVKVRYPAVGGGCVIVPGGTTALGYFYNSEDGWKDLYKGLPAKSYIYCFSIGEADADGKEFEALSNVKGWIESGNMSGGDILYINTDNEDCYEFLWTGNETQIQIIKISEVPTGKKLWTGNEVKAWLPGW